MRTSRLLCLTLLLMLVPALGAGQQVGGSSPHEHGARAANPSLAYAHLPLSFELNEGQTDGQVGFLAHGRGYSLFLTPGEAVLALAKPSRSSSGLQPQATFGHAVVRLEWLGANPRAKVVGEDELVGKSNYFIGRDPSGWRTNIPNYARVRYTGAYRGVDAVFYGRQGELEYDWKVQPGADTKQVRFRIAGGERVTLNAAGELVVKTGAGEVVMRRPKAYQESGTGRRRVAVRYAPRGRNEFGFEVGEYRRDQTLTIDPALTYATFLGGSGGDVAYAIGVDSSENAYVAGVTISADFPTSNAEQGTSGGNGDAFVSKLNPSGTALLYSTYLGGSESDSAAGLAVDKAGDVFLTGTTFSTDFPITPKSTTGSATAAFQTVYGGNGDAFVAELAGTGNKLVYCSYLGGSQADFGQAIAVDSSGNAYITGSTQSPDFPTLNPLQSTNAGSSDAFVTKVNFSGTALLYSTYLGGSQADTGQGIKIDGSGSIYIDGYTFSTDFPTKNPIQGSNAGDADAFVAELNAAGSTLTFSTYLGGSGRDRAFGIALDSTANIYVVGDTQSSNFPTTPSVFQSSYGGNGDAFVAKLTPSGASLSYSTFVGGSGVDQGNGIVVDSSGDAVAVGFTQSSDFPVVDPLQSVLNGTSGGSNCSTGPCADAFVIKLSPSGGQASYSTFLGGSGADFGQAVALDSSGNPFVTGSTSSSNFPAIAGAFQSALGGVAGNAFVAMIEAADSPAIALSPAKLNFGNETVSVRSSVQSVTVTDAGSAPLQITGITPPSSDFSETDNCIGTVAARGGTCAINVSFTPAATGTVTDQFTITDNATGSPHIITVTGTGVTQATAVTVTPTSLTFANLNVGSVSAPQAVTITNTGVATLNITKISTSGDFSETDTCTVAPLLGVLNVGQSCTVNVIFAPTATGSRAGSLSIADNATGSPQSVVLSGTGLPDFSVSSPSPAVSTLLGSTTATFSVTATASNGFTGSITLSCAPGATCSFSPASLFSGQTSTLTVSGLSASTPNPFNFTVDGTSGSQTATANLTLLLQTFSLSVSPALDTIVAGTPANYTVLMTPVNGFNQQVQLSCSNAPAGSTCTFTPASPTLNGTSPTSVGLKITTTQAASIWKLWPKGPLPPRKLWVFGALSLALVLLLLASGRRLVQRDTAGSFRPVASRALVLGAMLLLLVFLGGCRGVNTNTSTTPTGNYIITITGTLSSNSTVTVSTTVDLAVT